METNELNTRMCVTFYKAMIHGNFACRQVGHHRAHFAANDRTVVFNRHFRLGMVELEFHLPPCTDMVVPENGQEAPVQRCAEEEIAFQIPIVQDDEARTAVPRIRSLLSATLTTHSSTGRSERRTSLRTMSVTTSMWRTPLRPLQTPMQLLPLKRLKRWLARWITRA